MKVFGEGRRPRPAVVGRGGPRSRSGLLGPDRAQGPATTDSAFHALVMADDYRLFGVVALGAAVFWALAPTGRVRRHKRATGRAATSHRVHGPIARPVRLARCNGAVLGLTMAREPRHDDTEGEPPGGRPRRGGPSLVVLLVFSVAIGITACGEGPTASVARVSSKTTSTTSGAARLRLRRGACILQVHACPWRGELP
jgi:hypothetical protein